MITNFGHKLKTAAIHERKALLLPNFTCLAVIWVLLIKFFKKSIGFADKLTDGFSKMTRKTECMAH